MCERLGTDGTQHAGHPELWEGTSTLPESKGLEADLKMWEEVEFYLEHLLDKSDHETNPAVVVALTDSYNRCIEERRRCEDLLKLYEKWSSRRIGGVVEPES